MRRQDSLNLLLNQRASAGKTLEALMNFLIGEHKLFEHVAWLVLDGGADTEISSNATAEARQFLKAMEIEFSMSAKG
jgi:hypothetical protein